MPDLYSNTDDGSCLAIQQSSFAAARDNAGMLHISGRSTYSFATAVQKQSGRGGTVFNVGRSFFYFDTSIINPLKTVASATIKIRGFSLTSGDVIAVKSTAFGGDGGTALAASDFNNITGYSSGASLAGNATDYSAAFTSTWSTGGYNSLVGTSDLKADMASDDVVIICIMNYTYDYLNQEPASQGLFYAGAYFTENSGTSSDPYIEYEFAADGYGNAVSGVTSGNISKINGIATANISKVIGV